MTEEADAILTAVADLPVGTIVERRGGLQARDAAANEPAPLATAAAER